VEGKVLGDPRTRLIGAIGARKGSLDSHQIHRGTERGFDPHARILIWIWMALMRLFYPSLGLFSGARADPQLARRMCRAYNRWLADYCQPYPDRLFGVAMLPMQSWELAIEEMRYARQELGMRSGFLRPNPYTIACSTIQPYDPFWLSTGTRLCIGLHEGPAVCRRWAFDRSRARSETIISHTMEMQLAS